MGIKWNKEMIKNRSTETRYTWHGYDGYVCTFTARYSPFQQVSSMMAIFQAMAWFLKRACGISKMPDFASHGMALPPSISSITILIFLATRIVS